MIQFNWWIEVFPIVGKPLKMEFDKADLSSEKQRMLAIEAAALAFKEWLECEMPKEYGP